MFNPPSVEAVPSEAVVSDPEREPDPEVGRPEHEEALRRAQGYVDRGLLLFAAGHPAIAVGMFRHALLLNPRRSLAHYVLGVTLKAMGRDQEAALAWQTSLEGGEEAGKADADGDWARSRAQHHLGLLPQERAGNKANST